MSDAIDLAEVRLARKKAEAVNLICEITSLLQGIDQELAGAALAALTAAWFGCFNLEERGERIACHNRLVLKLLNKDDQ